MKLVINTCYGGFGLSEAAKKRYIELAGAAPKSWYDLKRNDKYLVQVVEELHHAANGSCAKLSVVCIEPGCWYRIDEYDGLETVQLKDLDTDWQLATD